MLDGKWSSETEGAYTVLSRPPYFTALALFPEGSTWGGGGRFLDNEHYVASGGSDILGKDDGLVRVLQRKPTDQCPDGLFLADGRCARVRASGQADGTGRKPMDLYDTLGGRLYARATSGQLVLIRDFTKMKFQPIRAPYDDTPEIPPEAASDKGWHPLDGDT
jgi:hypothetical protein